MGCSHSACVPSLGVSLLCCGVQAAPPTTWNPVSGTPPPTPACCWVGFDSLLWFQVGDNSASHDPVLHRDDLESLLNEVICHLVWAMLPESLLPPAGQCYPAPIAAPPRTVSIHHYFYVGCWPPPTCCLLPPGASHLGAPLSSGTQSRGGGCVVVGC